MEVYPLSRHRRKLPTGPFGSFKFNRDPSLINGAGFIVQQEDFRAHIAEYGKRIPFDPSDCRDHEAIKLATTKRGAGLAMSGVGTVDCARHNCKNPSIITILDHGEE